MNTLEELIKLGIEESTASRMLDSYKARIGEKHGCNVVTDINYTGNGERDIELTCSLCGAKYHSFFRHGSNKWRELRRTCPCQSIKNENPVKIVSIKNDDPQYIGKVYGDWKVIGFKKVPKKDGSYGSTVYWICECIHCGDVSTKQPSIVKNGKSCKCQKELKREEYWQSEIGKKYGRLTVAGIEHRIS